MSAIRTLRSRFLRPQLSLRYQCLRRLESTASEGAQSKPVSPPPSFFKRNRFPIACSTLALALGLMGGNMVLHTVAPPPLPNAGTHEDGVLIADLNKRIDEEFKVKVLRGKCLGVAKQLKGTAGGWVEIVPPPAEESRVGGDRFISLMQGAKGLGVERIFWDRGEHMLVAIIWYGASLSGWPGVTHGGAIATQLAEKTALAASLAEDRAAHASAAAVPQRMPGTGNHAKMFAPIEKADEPAQFSLSYKKPTYANNFYVIRVSPSVQLDQDPAKVVPSKPAGGHEYEATLETLDAKTCVEAKAKFAPSSTLRRVEDEVVSTARNSYAEFKSWLWPSRQNTLQLN